VQSDAPTAADAIELCVGRILAGEFADLALLDGHYLRRSDAEIFGDAAKSAAGEEPRVKVRRMVAGDVDRVVDLAARTQHAPGWQRQAYETAIDPESRPRRIALMAEERSTGDLVGYVVASVTAPEAELESIVTAMAHQRRGVARELFSALKAELRRQGVCEVMLEVRAGNHGAHEFYRFLGFAEEGRRPGYYSDPVEDAVLMRLRLKSSY
jgi:ribosomal-protein-alanine N-acetyltransferase